ncbi:MAG: UPF0149 family protein [Burkholderiaceae bacterium]|nr:UPF0149 family protein [Burkholderiaceae bacterium]
MSDTVLAELLDTVSGGKGMNLEQADGYFAALLCTPTMMPLGEFLPPLFGVESMDELEFDSQAQAQEAIALLMRHRNFIASQLARTLTDREAFYDPLLLEDETGVACANDWARAFLRGIAWDRQAWADLMADEQHGGAVLPIFALAHEDDPDPELRHTLVDESKRDELIGLMTVGLARCYAWFAPQRRGRGCGAAATLARGAEGRPQRCLPLRQRAQTQAPPRRAVAPPQPFGQAASSSRTKRTIKASRVSTE